MQDESLLNEVRKEFPLDNCLQELHLIRLQIRQETKDFTPTEYIQYITNLAEKARNTSR